MTTFLSLYGNPLPMMLHLPAWAIYALIGCLLAYKLALGGWILARTGRSPLWVLILLVPYANVAALWAFAYVSWPALPDDGADQGGADQGGADPGGAESG